MPRRPRPTSRQPPKAVREQYASQAIRNKKELKPRPDRRGIKRELSDPASEAIHDSDSEGKSGPDELRGDDSEGIEDESEDADAPRVVQWIDEDELDLCSDVTEVEGTDETGSSHIEKIKQDLSNLPLGVVRKAQRIFRQTEVDSDRDSDEESNQSSTPSEGKSGTKKEKVEWCLKPKSEIPKRHNKHAPIEISSKRPITRRRQVVEVKSYQARDPRFLPLTGEFSAEKYQNNYGFLMESRRDELNTLKENLRRARKSLSSAPRDQRTNWENEVKRLELAVKRTESLVNKDKQDRIQMEALQKAAREERDKRKQGKAGWWMKKGEKKKVVLEARYKALAEEGGKRAVKNTIEKKQKKIGQKEKRKRPVVRESEPRKRRRIE